MSTFHDPFCSQNNMTRCPTTGTPVNNCDLRKEPKSNIKFSTGLQHYHRGNETLNCAYWTQWAVNVMHEYVRFSRERETWWQIITDNWVGFAEMFCQSWGILHRGRKEEMIYCQTWTIWYYKRENVALEEDGGKKKKTKWTTIRRRCFNFLY